MKDEITIKNIKSFFLGNMNYYYDKVLGLPDHLKEQHYYRLFKCKDDCLKIGHCKNCTCPVERKTFAPESCNPERFPDFMNGSKWEEYKKENKINNIKEIITIVEDEFK